jgi:hypothetical protein
MIEKKCTTFLRQKEKPKNRLFEGNLWAFFSFGLSNLKSLDPDINHSLLFCGFFTPLLFINTQFVLLR